MARSTTHTARGLALGGAVAAILAAGLAGATSASAAGPADVTDGVLTVQGTAGADRIALRLAVGAPGVLEVDLDDDGVAEHSLDRATFDRILVEAGAGADRFRIDQANGPIADEALTVDGGAGDDVLAGGDGVELFLGGSGRDAVDGNRGNDRAELGSGNDSFTWDPGDGSDVVEGDSGDDTLDFNGAGANETMQLVAEGERAVFLRDVANIRMDMDGVERLDLTALGGTDSVTIDDMTGTDVRRALVDLSGPAGGGDGALDVVTVNGSAAADDIAVDAKGARVDVSGLLVTTKVTGAEPTDLLAVAAGDGDDDITVAPAAEAIVAVAPDLGAGEL